MRHVAPVLFLGVLLCIAPAAAQRVPADSVRAAAPIGAGEVVEMAPLVVTATRTAKALEEVAVPTTVVSAAEIRRQGAARLGDVLAAVPGLHLFDDHGTGLQVQGFGPEYTLILIDGQPVIGRTAGTLSLDRITVQGVERIELVRGPSSSLYGSEALAGVVNVITAPPPDGWGGGLLLRAGSFGTSDLAADVQAGGERAGLRLLVNRYASEGYDLSPDRYGPTAPAFSDWTTDLRARADVTDRLTLRLGLRAAVEEQESAFALSDAGAGEVRYDDEGRRVDWSVHPEAHLRLDERLRLRATLYGARYLTETRYTRQDDGSLFFSDDFDQRLARAEVQADVTWGARHLTVLGGGATDERLESDRYDFRDEQPAARHAFAFAQHEWLPHGRVEVNASARFDAHSDYASRLSPKLALLVRPAETVRLRASVGSGFKAPDFRQLYLAFTNAAAGYSVFGATRLRAGVEQLVDEGRVEDLYLDPATLQPIRTETSVAYNVGGTVEPTLWLSASANAFYNDVANLIETQPVARKASGQFVYGYFNLAEVYTRGVEAEVTLRPRAGLKVALGYQFLQARDRAVVEALARGSVFGRDPDGREYRLGVSDYGGLFGRSPHSATLRAAYAVPSLGLTASLRARWRSRYGYRDLDGNQIANRDDEFVRAYTVLDATLTKAVRGLGRADVEALVGVDNAADVARPTTVPSMPGRRLYAGLRLTL